MSDAPRRDEPFRFTEEPEPESSPAMTWAMRALGLVAVAVLSGVVYWYINDKPAGSGGAGPQQTSAAREGVYDFAVHPQVQQPRTDTDCPGHAYGKTKTFLAEPGVCAKIVQALYTTKAGNRDVLVSVSVVHMSSADKAIALQELTQQDKTGNVSDLVRQKVVKVDGLDSLANGGGYESRVDGSTVTIVEADFSKPGKHDEATLDKVCEDALRLGEKIDQGS